MSASPIFISYRRIDSPGHAGRLGDSLRNKYGVDNIFKDVTNIRGGADFSTAIKNAIKDSSVLIAVIGPNWMGKRFLRNSRIFNQDDWVRQEIETAGKNGKNILPVLVNQGYMPEKNDLPRDLWFLANLNAVSLRDETWDSDLLKVFEELDLLRKSRAPVIVSDDENELASTKGFTKYSLITLSILLVAILAYLLDNNGSKNNNDNEITTAFIHVNDLKQIDGTNKGTSGGLARLATLKQMIKDSVQNTFMVMAGNFLSPSIYNRLRSGGSLIMGRQMIETMNTAQFDFAIFGSHEFDFNANDLQKRVNESNFQWISSNISKEDNGLITPFFKKKDSNVMPIPRTYILSIKDADGTTAKIGLIGIATIFNRKSYVSYSDPIQTAKMLYQKLKDSCDAVIAITNQPFSVDSLLAVELPDLSAILGGLQHQDGLKKIGKVPIIKSDVASAFVVFITINKEENTVEVTPVFKDLNRTIRPDYVTNLITEKWVTLQQLALFGVSESETVYDNGEPLDARETSVRSRATNFTRLITTAIKNAIPKTDVVLFNAGYIQGGEVLSMPVTTFDIFRTLPFGGALVKVRMKGNLLLQVLEQGRRNAGMAGFLLYNDELVFSGSDKAWKLNNFQINTLSEYNVVMPEYLLSGHEQSLFFLNRQNSGILKIFPNQALPNASAADIRVTVINYLKYLKKSKL